MHGTLEHSWQAALVSAVAAFALGALWYSPALFGTAWARETGSGAQALAQRSGLMTYGVSFALTVIAALVFALFLGPKPGVVFAVGAGISTGLGWVAASFGINYLFERRSFRLFLINGGYHTAQFTLYGLILGLWP